MPTSSAGHFPLWAWFVFAAVLLGFIAIDLILHRGTRGRSRGAAITWTAVWIGIGFGFAFVVWATMGGQRAGEYVAAYLILAVDSVPAALAISPSRFVVNSSNALAILGLRSLYVLLEHLIAELKYLHYGASPPCSHSPPRSSRRRGGSRSRLCSPSASSSCVSARRSGPACDRSDGSDVSWSASLYPPSAITRATKKRGSGGSTMRKRLTE